MARSVFVPPMSPTSSMAEPPNQTNIFCVPYATKTTPNASVRMVRRNVVVGVKWSKNGDFVRGESRTQLGMVGLGRMGANMVRRLIQGGHDCVVFNRSPKAVNDLVKENAVGAVSLSDLVSKLKKP